MHIDTSLRSFLVLLPLATLAACGGHGKRAPAHATYGADASQHTAVSSSAPASRPAAAPSPPTSIHTEAPSAADADYGEAAPESESIAEHGADQAAPSSARSGSPYRRPPVEERPGLGTVYGETMHSSVRQSPFIRGSHQPFATVAVHYNDEEGVRAHAGYLGSAQLAPMQAHTPHGGISVALTDERGALLPGGAAGGRVLVVGREGARYNIVLHNHTGGRYEIVASVDGLDVIDGRPADLAKRGYILEPHGTLTIDGFRRSEHHVAAFRFGRVSQSYAARTSGARNVGVIGVALFAEQGSQWTSDELYRRDTANPFPGDRAYAQPPRY